MNNSDLNKKIKLEFNMAELNTIVQCLGEAPAKISFSVLKNIDAQTNGIKINASEKENEKSIDRTDEKD